MTEIVSVEFLEANGFRVAEKPFDDMYELYYDDDNFIFVSKALEGAAITFDGWVTGIETYELLVYAIEALKCKFK